MALSRRSFIALHFPFLVFPCCICIILVIRDDWVEPCEFWENADTKRRFHNLVTVSGFINSLIQIKARYATMEEVTLFHTVEYFNSIAEQAKKGGGTVGEYVSCGPDGLTVSLLSAGGVLAAVDAVLNGVVDNAYCLVRPPGHHAERDKAMGFCIFNNIAIAALYARTVPGSPS